MQASNAIYAVKKRKKPLQKVPKLPPPEGAKSNPSKRHRDRLNSELDKLTSLLPFSEDVRARLDKLSVLRLGVGYLKVKSFFKATLKNRQNEYSNQSPMFGSDVQNAPPRTSQVTSIDGVSFSEGDLLLQALNGFVLVVTTEGYVFYASPTIQDFLGFHMSDTIHQSVFELIHTDDRALFRQQLHFAFSPHSSQHDCVAEDTYEQHSALRTYDLQVIPPENSSFLERSFCCRFRCLLDNSSGFVALNFCGRLKFLHGQNQVSELGEPVAPQMALFAIATPLQPPSILEIRSKTLIFQTKHKLDFTPLGIDTRGKVVLGYSEVELCMKGSGYNFIHAADMMHCADNHVRMIKTGESGFTVFRLLTKKGVWLWVQANARLVLKEGKPDFIVARQRALTNEEGEENFRLHRQQQLFGLTTSEALLYETAPTVNMPDTCSPAKQRKLDNYSVRPHSLLGCMLNQDPSVYCQHNSANPLKSLHDTAFKDTHATVSVPGDIWHPLCPKATVESMIKSEDTIQDMVETLQQILGDSDLSNTVDVTPDELKSWESTLLKVKTNSCDLGNDLNDFTFEEVLIYVEEQLQKESMLKLPDQLDTCVPNLNFSNQGSVQQGMGQIIDWPQEPQSQLLPSSGSEVFRLPDQLDTCIPTLNFSNQGCVRQGMGQNIDWPQEPQSQSLPSSGQMAEQPSAVVGMMKLTHIDLPHLSSPCLNGSVAEPIFSQQTLSLPIHLHGDQGHTGRPAKISDPGLVDSSAKVQKSRRIQVSFKDNNQGILLFKQPSQIQRNQIVQPNRYFKEQRAPNLAADHHGQRQSKSKFQSCQRNSNHHGSQNVSTGPVITADPAASSCTRSHFVLPAQGGQNQSQSWQLEHPSQQQLISNESLSIKQLSEFQPIPSVAVNHNPALYREMFRTQFPVEHDIGAVTASSCSMFKNTTTPVSVNIEHPSCFYQGEGKSMFSSNMEQLSCQITPNYVNLDNPPIQQPYLNLSDQLTSHSVVENGCMASYHNKNMN